MTNRASAQPNLLQAGDFEGINSLIGYWPASAGAWGTETSALSGAANGITPFGSQMLLIAHGGGGSASQTSQSVEGPFLAGSVVTFTTKFNTWLTGKSVALIIQTDDGLLLNGPRYQSPSMALDSDTSTWQTVTWTTTLTSDTNYISAEIVLWQASGALAPGTPLAAADDAVLTVVPPAQTQTLTILGGLGNVGEIAPNVEYYNPHTSAWQPAYLADKRPGNPGVEHDWGVIPGTNHWINYLSNGSLYSDPGAGPTTANTLWYLYRVRFNVPADAQNATMTFSIKADNFAQVAINGVSTGPTINGTANGVNADAVFASALQPGENTITINVGDFGGLNGFNFRIDLSILSAEPLEVVDPDNTPPVITGPGNITTEATGPSGAIVNYLATAVDDVDGSVPVSALPPSGSTFALGTTVVGLGAMDAAGNIASETFDVTVRDTAPPIITSPSDITREATSAAGANVGFIVKAYDIVDGVVPALATPGRGIFPLGTTTVDVVASDNSNNTANTSFDVTVQDTRPPVISVNGHIIRRNVIRAEATGPDGAVVTFTATAEDRVDGNVPVATSHLSGSTFRIGGTIVKLTATDAHNNTATRQLRIIVSDTTAPVVNAPADITAEATGPDGAVVDFTATATDAVGVTSLTYSINPGSTFGLGTTEVTVTARDASGNRGTATFTVTVVDTTAPAISAPADITVEAAGPDGTVVDYLASATDLVDGAVAVTTSAASGSTFAIGSTTVTLTAIDAAGNGSEASFTVTVVDTTPPEITSVTPSTDTLWSPNHKMVPITVAVDASDLVGITSLKIISATSSEPDNGKGDGNTINDTVITGDLTVDLRAERAGKGDGRIYTITVEATDAAGNSSTSTCTVTVPKNGKKSSKSEKSVKSEKSNKNDKSVKSEKNEKSKKGKKK